MNAQFCLPRRVVFGEILFFLSLKLVVSETRTPRPGLQKWRPRLSQRRRILVGGADLWNGRASNRRNRKRRAFQGLRRGLGPTLLQRRRLPAFLLFFLCAAMPDLTTLLNHEQPPDMRA